MKLLKTTTWAFVFGLMLQAFTLQALAITDEEQVEYTTGLSEGDVKVVKQYIESGKVKPDDFFFGWNSLEIATNAGQIKVVEYLISKKANLNHQHQYSKNSAFHLAAFNNLPEIVKLLAKSGADVNLKLLGDVSIIRAVRDAGNTEMVKVLESVGVKDDGCQEEKCN